MFNKCVGFMGNKCFVLSFFFYYALSVLVYILFYEFILPASLNKSMVAKSTFVFISLWLLNYIEKNTDILSFQTVLDFRDALVPISS